uniref:Peptidase S1 domain-containing protein n=1 Tax=Salmo trutta TaxID=8032 RepID=A0A674DBV9_SALTR
MKLLLLAFALGCDGALLQEVFQPHSRPWQVYLWNTKGGWYGEGRCRGALINEWWVLTAWNSRGPSHSLAMVKLAEPAWFTQHVMPVALPTGCTQFHEKCLRLGGGLHASTQFNGIDKHQINSHESLCQSLHTDEPKLILKCETQRVIDDKMCQIAFPLYWIEHAFCAKTIISTDNCLSDQGSTVVCGGELKGLFWSGSSDVGLYTRLCLYLDWISDVMNTPDPTPEPVWTTAAAATTW